MRWIFLSPHLDDAVLSAGGLIYDRAHAGLPVEIWTVMSGTPAGGTVSPFAELLHSQWGFSSAEETIRARRAEDSRAAAVVGARAVHFHLPDCIYRRGSNGDWLYSDVFVPPHPEDAGLPKEIAGVLAARLRPDDVVVCQMAVGSHVDHVLVRQGAELAGHPLLYDIDLPYIFMKPEEFREKSAGMSESIYPISEPGLAAWQAAVGEYKSQLPGLGDAMSSPEKARDSIRSYWEPNRGIKILQVR